MDLARKVSAGAERSNSTHCSDIPSLLLGQVWLCLDQVQASTKLRSNGINITFSVADWQNSEAACPATKIDREKGQVEFRHGT